MLQSSVRDGSGARYSTPARLWGADAVVAAALLLR